MTQITSILTGATELLNRLKSIEEKQTEAMVQTIDECCQIVVADARKGAPVDTGYMRANILYEVATPIKGQPITGKVGVGDNVGYASHVEFGYLRGAKPRPPAGVNERIPFLYPALSENFSRIEKKIEDTMARIFQ